jgi:RimJ/RimL family protein N-acetyltransferase
MEQLTGTADGKVSLRKVLEEDIPVFFEQQLDPQANEMAAFTSREPSDRQAFEQHWERLRSKQDVFVRTVLYNGQVAGHIVKYVQFLEPEVGYWLGREFWGRGIATRGLELFLGEIQERPLNARAAKDNLASIRVLEKCGFRKTGESKGFANARGAVVEEAVFILEE